MSRLGVIKLCDFGFARPYLENETLTDYVATRWYRSPELLVGDRYGKEVDIWAVGCLYSEMMTGEPLFPGESDIDQLFQIVRILGKLSPRHQILIMRNAMFRGMKQEQNTTLSQMFPNWNRDSIDFLNQCLRMDGNARPDSMTMLKHELFSRDNFLDTFLSELRTKLSQEMQVNPLLKRIPSYGSNNRWNNNSKDEKKTINSTNQESSGNSTKHAMNHKKSSGDDKKELKSMEKSSKSNLSVLSTQLLQSNTLTKSTAPNNEINNSTNSGNSNNSVQMNKTSTNNNNPNGDNQNNNDDLPNRNDEMNKANLLSAKQRTSTINNNNDDNNQQHLQSDGNDAGPKQIPMNNLTFKDNNKYSRVLSAKLHKSSTLTVEKKNQMVLNNNLAHNSTHSSHPFDLQFQSQSPLSFQSLQPEPSLISNEQLNSTIQNKRLSPVTHFTSIYHSNNNSNDKSLLLNGQNLPQYFTHRRHSNVLSVSDQLILPKNTQFSKSTTNQIPSNMRTGTMVKRERNLIDATLKTLNTVLPNDSQSQSSSTIQQTKEPSPRILPPPQWLTGNLKLTAHGYV